MTDPITRPTRADDIVPLQRVLRETDLFPAELLPGLLSEAASAPDAALWLTALAGGVPVGLCYAVPEALTEGTWNIRALAVRPDHQGRRLGSALVAATERRLRDAGRRMLIVDTSGTADFALTRRFYLRNGYEEEARIRDFWAAGDDKVVYRKRL